MSIIYKNIILLFFCILTNFIFGNNSEGQEYDKEKIKNKSASIWRYEINYPPLTTKSGLRSQIFFLILYDDGGGVTVMASCRSAQDLQKQDSIYIRLIL